MKKRITAAVLACLLAMLAVCVSSAAPAETTVTISKDVKYKDGYTTISWKVKGDKISSCMVFAKAVNGKAEQGSLYLGIAEKNKIKTGLLIPGKKYEIKIVGNGFRTLGEQMVKIPKAESFNDGKLKASSVKVTVEPVRKKSGSGKDPSKLKSLKAKDIKKYVKNGEYDYGVKYHLQMPRLTKSRTFFVQIAFEAPNGFLDTVVADNIEFERVNNGYQTLWFKILGDSFMKNLYKTTQEIPEGKYTIYMYWDGMLVNKTTFQVS